MKKWKSQRLNKLAIPLNEQQSQDSNPVMPDPKDNGKPE